MKTRTEKKAEKITAKIKGITAQKTPVIATYRTRDESVQAELRLSVEWRINVPVDAIQYPRDLSGQNADMWSPMWPLWADINKAAKLAEGRARIANPINERTKTGPARRSEAKAAWLIEAGQAFLADYRTATKKRRLADARKQITDLQAQQKALLPKLREANSLYLAGKKTERVEQAARNAEALKSGRFWEADREALKGYFHPPFDKNFLADVSEKWRAALFLECESVSFKTYSGDWGHKLAGTHRGWLCGIDDNGDEWGHHCQIPQSQTEYGDARLEGTVEEAMADLFDIAESELAKCTRQGDLLFCPAKIRREDGLEHCRRCGEPREKHCQTTLEDGMTWLSCYYRGNTDEYDPHVHRAVVLTPEEKWTPRESHEIASPSLRRNGRYFAADDEIVITHTSHPVVTLPPGEYSLYALRIADAD